MLDNKIYTEREMVDDVASLTEQLELKVAAHVAATKQVMEARDALKEAERMAEEAKGYVSMLQLGLYEQSKQTGVVGPQQVITGSNETTRKAQLEAHLRTLAADKGSEYGGWLSKSNQLRLKLGQAEMQQAETRARLEAVYAVINIKTALMQAITPLNQANAQLTLAKMLRQTKE